MWPFEAAAVKLIVDENLKLEITVRNGYGISFGAQCGAIIISKSSTNGYNVCFQIFLGEFCNKYFVPATSEI
jgi:hypothetical protein